MQNIEERDIETKFWNAEKKLFIWSIIESVFILWYLFGMIGIIFYLFFDYIFALVLMLAFLLFFPKKAPGFLPETQIFYPPKYGILVRNITIKIRR